MGFEIRKDEIAERLDELADLGAVWNKHREAGRTPHAVRQAMITVAGEIEMLRTINEQGLLGEVRRNDGQNNEGDLVDNS